jgi:uncharacterized protein (TIGR03067 family)
MTQSHAGAVDLDLMPTGENIRRELKTLLKRAEDDTVLLAFSGHGVQLKESKQHHFCPQDAKLADAKTLLPLSEVYEQMGACKARLKVLLVDACRKEPEDTNEKFKVRLTEPSPEPQKQKPPAGIAALYSCAAEQFSYESDKLQHGVFFHSVLEGLRGKAANRKGEVTLEKLAAFVKEEVDQRVKDLVGRRAEQTPHLVGDLPGASTLVAGVQTAKALLKELEGTYTPTSFTLHGHLVPDSALKNTSFIFQGNTMTMKFKQGDTWRETVYTITLDQAKTPIAIDLTPQGGTSAGMTWPGIIKVEKGTVSLCYVISKSNEKGRPTEFSSTEENGYWLFVLKKDK